VSPPGNRRYTAEQKSWYCRKFDEGQRAWPITPAEYAREMGIVVQVFYRWLRERGTPILYPKWTLTMHNDAANDNDGRVRYWRHGGVTTKGRA